MIREVSFNGNPIRIFDDGYIWVYATDIAKLLGGANNVTQLTRNLSDSDIKRVDGHRTIVINESGFYNMTAGKKNGSELRKFAEENIFKIAAPKEETGVTIFNNDQFGDLRSIEKDGEIWFAAPDICRSLQIQNTTQALLNLDADERSMFYIAPQVEMNFVSEPGLYTLISRSNKPNAKTFRRWVTHEVLPSIRKTGSYSVTGNTDDDILRQAFDILQRRNNEWQVKYEALLIERNNLQLQLDNVKKALGLNNDPSPSISSEDPIDYIHHNRKILHNFLNTCIRSYTQKRLGSNSFGLGWSDFYNRLKKGLGQDIRLRGEPYIDHIADEEMSAAVYVANSMKPSTTYIEDETMAVVQKVLAA